MKNFLITCLTFCFFGCQSESIPLYIGTYTSGDSEGIYYLPFNQETGEIGVSNLAATIKNPSFLTYSPDKKFVYAVGEIGDYNGEKTGAVTAFKVLSNGSLEQINTVASEGEHPCHVVMNPEGTRIAVSNYSGGTLSIYTIKANGGLEEASQVFDHNTPKDKSHVHSAAFVGDYLYAADLGRNSIYQYKITDGSYVLKSPSIVTFEPNAGPRHFTFSSKNDFLYVIHEYANTVTSLKHANGVFELISHSSTLESPGTTESYCADIHLSNSGKNVYGSNRGENSIVVFDRNLENGKLSKAQSIRVEGDWPRNFTLSPNGKFLLVANQKSENISVFSVDQKNGQLSFQSEFKFPSPVCLIF